MFSTMIQLLFYFLFWKCESLKTHVCHQDVYVGLLHSLPTKNFSPPLETHTGAILKNVYNYLCSGLSFLSIAVAEYVLLFL